MTDFTKALLAAASIGLSMFGCTQGGQTYDDGSDGVRNNNNAAGANDGSDEDAGTSPSATQTSNGGGGNTATCQALQGDAFEAVSALRDAADRSCTLDMDCIRTGSTPSCLDSCGSDVVVSQTGVDAIASGLDELEATVCREFDDAGCVVVPSGCPGDVSMINRCVAGRCESQPEDPNGSGGGSGDGGSAGTGGGNGGNVNPAGGSAGTDVAECFTPSENVEVAYAGDIDGCTCNEDDVGSVCVGGVAIICIGGAWRALEDAACEPGFRNQPCDGRVDSAMTCVELFDICYDLSTGSFCGQGRRTDLCDDGEIVEDPSGCLQDDAFCSELDNGLYCTGGAAPTCPEGYTPIDDCPLDVPWCFQYSESLACRVPTFTAMECEAVAGTVVGDPGDGSVYNEGCPDDGTLLGTVDGCIEGCLCCAP